MSEWQLFEPGTIPEYCTPAWYAERDTAPHLEQDGHRQRLLLTAEMVTQALGGVAQTVCDLGAGDGGLLSLLPASALGFGYDLQPSNVAASKARGVHVSLFDVVNSEPYSAWEGADILVCAEFLEHLIDPHGFLDRCFASEARYLVASSPYTETDESHYGYHTWAWDLDGYRKLVEDAGWRVVRQETAWISQVILAERP